jgi:hypothetical protein
MIVFETIVIIFYIMATIVVGAMVCISMYNDLKKSIIYIIEWIKDKSETGNKI